MTPNEFSELTGKNINANNFMDEYTFANAAYMAAGDLDKKTFCADYKKHGLTSTVCALTEQVDKLNRFNATAKAKMEKVGMALIDLSANASDPETAESLYDLADILMGCKQAIIYRIHRGYKLSESDREYVIDILNDK